MIKRKMIRKRKMVIKNQMMIPMFKVARLKKQKPSLRIKIQIVNPKIRKMMINSVLPTNLMSMMKTTMNSIEKFYQHDKNECI